MRTSRTTGVSAGLLVLLLGVWAGIIPFVGPYFHYGFAPDATWHFTLDRLWLNILPGAAAVLGGLMMMSAGRRGGGLLGAWLALAGGLWLVLGPSVSLFWSHAAPGTLQSGIGAPLGGPDRAAVEMIGFFYGAGALVTMLSVFVLGAFTLVVPVAAAAGAGAAGASAMRRREEAPAARAGEETEAARRGEEPAVGHGEERPAAGAGEEPPAAGTGGERPPTGAGGESVAPEEAPRRGLIRRRRRRGAVPGERAEGGRRI